jgi:hypothetical protein
MKQLSITFFLAACSTFGYAQTESEWFAFYNEDSTLFGFRNAQGKILSEPKFVFVGNEAFNKVVSVVEQLSEDDYSIYYLRADGTKFGEDSVYFWDQAPEIESNGYVRFKDPVSKKVGVMDYTGKIIFPAEFDEMREIRNGFVLAIRGAHKECWDKDVPIENCEHADWVGGEKVLYNVSGELLSRSFFADATDFVNLDYYTFKKSKKPSKDPFRVNFKAEGKGYFSFVNLDKTFDVWVQKNLLKDPSIDQAEFLFADSVVTWEEETGWTVHSKLDLLMLRSLEYNDFMTMLKSKKYSYFNTYQEDFFLYEFSGLFGKYFNGPYQFDHWKYPLYDVIVTNETTNEQSQLSFLRTDKGWKVISVALR